MLLREGNTWRLYGAVHELILLRSAEARARGLPVEAPAVAARGIARCLADPASRAALRTLFAAIGVSTPEAHDTHWGYAEQAELQRRIERALDRGVLVAVRVARPDFVPRAKESAAPEPVVGAAPAPAEETTWIAIRLVDEADPSRPVPHVRYRITLPDGAAREGRVDAAGYARVDGIDPGTCKVTFPDLDGRDWQAG